MKGIFVTFEGPEGAGKTTQVQLVVEYLKKQNVPYLYVREPGGTRIGDLIRQILLDPDLTEMVDRTEMLLYAASRAQLVEQKIRPALMEGQVVICDRYVDSSIVYQSMGANKDIDEVLAVNRIATGGLKPDRTYLLDIPVEMSQQRIALRGNGKDRIELKEYEFHIRVREGYLSLAKQEPERFQLIRADQSVERIFDQIINDLVSLLK
jgi:dTMP kinase